MGSYIPPILTFTHFIMEVYSTLNAPLAYLSFLHILFFLPLSLLQERVVKLKGCLMFHPKNIQTLLRISNPNKFLYAFYNHKYYSFCIWSNQAYSYTISQSSANTSDDEGTQESALPSGLMMSIWLV